MSSGAKGIGEEIFVGSGSPPGRPGGLEGTPFFRGGGGAATRQLYRPRPYAIEKPSLLHFHCCEMKWLLKPYKKLIGNVLLAHCWGARQTRWSGVKCEDLLNPYVKSNPVAWGVGPAPGAVGRASMSTAVWSRGWSGSENIIARSRGVQVNLLRGLWVLRVFRVQILVLVRKVMTGALAQRGGHEAVKDGLQER